MRKWVDELMPIVLDMMQDSSSLPKREVSYFFKSQKMENIHYYFLHCNY